MGWVVVVVIAIVAVVVVVSMGYTWLLEGIMTLVIVASLHDRSDRSVERVSRKKEDKTVGSGLHWMSRTERVLKDVGPRELKDATKN